MTATAEKYTFFTRYSKAQAYAEKHGLQVIDTPEYMAEFVYYPYMVVKYEKLQI